MLDYLYRIKKKKRVKPVFLYFKTKSIKKFLYDTDYIITPPVYFRFPLRIPPFVLFLVFS